jgi:hypothetical protein
VSIALNPDELADQLGDEEALKERYEQEVEARQAAKRLADDDSDDEQGGGRKKRKGEKGWVGGKKGKEFKF